MHIITKWKGAPLMADYPCYCLTDQHKGGFFACTFSVLNNIVRIYNATRLLPREIRSVGLLQSVDTADKSEFTEAGVFSLFFKNNSSINIYKHFHELNCPENHKVPVAFASRPYSEINFKQLCPFWNRFFSPQDKIHDVVEDFINKYGININETLGVFYRGTDKVTEEQLPEYTEYIEKTKQMFKDGNYKRILLQTDEKSCYEAFKKEFKEKVFIIKETRFSETGDGIHKELRGSDQLTQHSVSILATVLLFAGLPSILVNTSHVSYSMVMYRGNLNNVVQYRRGKFLEKSS